MVKYEDHYEALSDVFESKLCISITHENMYIQMAIPVDLHGGFLKIRLTQNHPSHQTMTKYLKPMVTWDTTIVGNVHMNMIIADFC